jgi:hypothetical protein
MKYRSFSRLEKAHHASIEMRRGLTPHVARARSARTTRPDTRRRRPNMASAGALSSRPRLAGRALRADARRAHRAIASRNAARLMPARAAHQPGVNMPEGPADDLNKWSRKITQPKSQGASQARRQLARPPAPGVAVVPRRRRRRRRRSRRWRRNPRRRKPRTSIHWSPYDRVRVVNAVS